MDKEIVLVTYNGMLLKKERNQVLMCYAVDRCTNHAERRKPDSISVKNSKPREKEQLVVARSGDWAWQVREENKG